MPKYIGRIQFETMKVLRKRGGSINNIAEAVGLSKGAVSRNLKYKTYEEYLAAMYSHKSKFQKEVEAKSGPVTVTSYKTCYKCGEKKVLSEFDKDKNMKSGYSNQCKSCRRAYQREMDKKRREKVKNIMESLKPEKEETEKHEHVVTYQMPDWANMCWSTEHCFKEHKEEESKDEVVENESKELEEDKNIPVGERVWVKIDKGIKRGVVVSVNDLDYTVRYLVKLNGLFGKYITTTEDKMFR